MTSSTLPLLGRLLRDTPVPIVARDAATWWHDVIAHRTGDRVGGLGDPIDQAILAGFVADRVGYALAGGYEAALRALVPSLPQGAIATFCATEAAGNHPRAIATRLAPRPGGGFTLSGAKRWSTMGPLASALLVVASEGAGEAGRNRLRVVRVDAGAPGVHVTPMPATPFVPEVPHAEIELDGVAVDAAAVLPGDGYADYLKPFRTVEDIHVHAAIMAYVLSVARRYCFPQEAAEQVVAGLVAAQALAALPASAPEVHVALAGLLSRNARLLDDLPGAWETVDAAERQRWDRDRALFGSVAASVRERRRQRAWESLAESTSTE